MKSLRKNILTVLIISVLLLSTTNIPKSQAASQTSINDAITKGLNWLVSAQYNAPGNWYDGAWPYSGYPAAEAAMAVLAFEDTGHLPGNASDPYHTVVEKGLDFIFTRANVIALSVQPAGDPDSNGNGIGIRFEWGETTYVTPMVLMAIVASGNKSRVATTGPAGVIGRTYYDIAVDIVDWLAYGQNDVGTGNYRGGWRYEANYGSSDNSNSQWPALGLMTAELWGINAPSWVKSELLYWLTYSQNLDNNPSTNYYYGSFGYDSKYYIDDVAETAAGIAMLSYCGVIKTDSRMVAAQGYLVRDWATWDGSWRTNFNMGLSYANEYAMFAIMKTMKLAKPTPIKTIVDYAGSPTIEWYNGTNQYADWLVAKQFADGHWNPWWYWDTVMDTAWGVLILLPYAPVVVKYDFTVLAKDSITGNPISGATVNVEGPETYSGSTGADGKIKFPSIQAGEYNVSVSASHYYQNSTKYTLTFNSQYDVKLTPIVHDLTVLVKDSVTGDIITGASVQVAGPETRSDSTGGDGKVNFVGLREGDYTVTVSATGYYTNVFAYSFTADAELEVPLTLIVYNLTVLVKNAVSGDPIPGATVQIVGPESRTGTTQADGKVKFLALKPGNYNVTVSASGFNPNSVLQTLSANTELEVPLTSAGVTLSNRIDATPAIINLGNPITVTLTTVGPAAGTITVTQRSTGNSWTINIAQGAGSTAYVFPTAWPAGANTNTAGAYDVLADITIAGLKYTWKTQFQVEFFVVPELPLGILMATVASFAAWGMLKKYKTR